MPSTPSSPWTRARSSGRDSLSAPRILLLCLGALLLLALPAAAHECWIQPERFRAAPGERVDVHLWVGHPGTAEAQERPRDVLRLVRFESVEPEGSVALPGVDGRAPAAILRTRVEGLHVLVYRSTHAFAELEAARYEAYLDEMALDDVRAERVRRGESEEPGRDSYVRCAKALVRVGAGDEALADRAVGLSCEIVLETRPAAWRVGDALLARVFFEGAPLANRRVTALRLEAPFDELVARTDADGRVRFAPERGGAWGLFAVHQRRASEKLRRETGGDWEGFWASSCFALGTPEASDAGEPGAGGR